MTIEVLETPTLDDLAASIHADYHRSRVALGDAVECYFSIGHALLEARARLHSDRDFGAWFQAQDFGFTRQWARILRLAAEYEPQVRLAVESQLSTGHPDIYRAVRSVRQAALGPARVIDGDGQVIDDDRDTYPTIVIDPPWQYDNRATRGAASKHYPTMSVDELAELTIDRARGRNTRTASSLERLVTRSSNER